MREIELRTDFATGAFGNIQKLEKLLITISFVAFGNVRDYRDRSATNLIPKAKVATEVTSQCYVINIVRELSRELPRL